MDGRGPSGWLRALAIVILVLVVGGIAYTVGVGAGSAGVAVAPAGTPVVYAPWGHGFGFFGLLFPILFILLLFAIFSGGRRSGRHYGGYGPGGWYGPRGEHRDVPPAYEPMLEAWHRRVHGEPGTEPPPKS